jgi:hypothetical protein
MLDYAFLASSCFHPTQQQPLVLAGLHSQCNYCVVGLNPTTEALPAYIRWQKSFAWSMPSTAPSAAAAVPK